MRFTAAQYDQAIESLRSAREQLEPDGLCCACCGDSGHQAFECGFNPLVAMAICKAVANDAEKLHGVLHSDDGAEAAAVDHKEKLHEIVHWLAGFDMYMGERIGPAKVVLPEAQECP